MSVDLFDTLESEDTQRCLAFSDNQTGLRAFLVLDDLTLGPAAGGIRTQPYRSYWDALKDAQRLARAMTIKCSLAELAAGGGKAVVIEHGGMKRAQAFERLGEFIEELGGLFRTAGDLGTTIEDLNRMAQKTRYVHANVGDLSAAVGRGVLRSIEACVKMRGMDSVKGIRVAIQGCGAIGSAVARALTSEGALVFITDIDKNRVQTIAEQIDAQILPPDKFWLSDVDVLLPCAIGRVLDSAVAESVKAHAVCGAANNILADSTAEQILMHRDILFVPDVISSAGAVVEGIGTTVMKMPDCSPLIDKIGETALAVLEESRQRKMLPTQVAEKMAWERIELAKTK